LTLLFVPDNRNNRNRRSNGGRRAPSAGRISCQTLNPGDVVTADVTAYAIDTSTGDACPRRGNLVVTSLNGFVSHPMSVDVPICNASVSSVH
jgi:hypothetical protein